MSVVKRFNRLLGLDTVDVLVDEVDTSRHIIITDMPESLPQGKSSFLIEVSPYMRDGIELQIDFIDSRGNSIYTEPIMDYLEGSSRTVSVDIYEDTEPGIATLIIVGELATIPLDPGSFSDIEDVPQEWVGVYNVRLTREVIINSAAVNTQPIKFYTVPRLTSTELRFGTMIREDRETSVTSSIFQVEGVADSGREFSEFPSSTDQNTSQQNSSGQGSGTTNTTTTTQQNPPTGKVFGKGDATDIDAKKRATKKKSVRGSSKSKRGRSRKRRRSPVQYPYTFAISSGSHTFTTEQIGGNIVFSGSLDDIYDEQVLDAAGFDDANTIVSTQIVFPSQSGFPTYFTASISDLENSVTAYATVPFTKQNPLGEYIIMPLRGYGSVHYEIEPSASYSLVNLVSYADVKLTHLRTFSGDVFKAKVYVRAEGSFDDFKLLAEVPLESPELMVNNDSVGIGERTGYFVSEDDKDTYWDVFGSTNGLSTATSTTTASFDNDTLLDSVQLSGSISEFTDQIRFQLKDAYKFNLVKELDYTFSFNAKAQSGTDGRALMLLYVSGSSMLQSSNVFTDEETENEVSDTSAYGKRLGWLTTSETSENFGITVHNFNPVKTGDAVVQFRVISGQWNISDVSVTPSADTGFSPSFIEFKQELPSELQHKRPETLEFLAEFYDINNNLADEICFTTGSVFTGTNLIITGEDNVLQQNLFIGGGTTGSGIHMGGTTSTLPETGGEGADGSGFIRSVGYLGFTSASAQSGSYGFMIYSGSVLPNSGDDYKGVGLELVGQSGSLKFRTSPSVFDVQADAFFVGKKTTQYISGSNQNIEISSSAFHLDTVNNSMILSGSITATDGNIGGWTIKDNSLAAGTGHSSVTMSGADQVIKMGSGSALAKNQLDGII